MLKKKKNSDFASLPHYVVLEKESKLRIDTENTRVLLTTDYWLIINNI